MDERVMNIADQVAQMSQNLAAYFHHVGFTPPFPPIPQSVGTLHYVFGEVSLSYLLYLLYDLH